jgi:Domain of unknown function (DUF4157)
VRTHAPPEPSTTQREVIPPSREDAVAIGVTGPAPGSAATRAADMAQAVRFAPRLADIPARAPDEEAVQRRAHGVVQRAAQDNLTGLPGAIKAGVESLSGVSLDHVRVHYGSSSPAQLNALAYTKGSEIHVAPGQEKHLAHEAWHAAQQAQGRVQATAQLAGVALNDDKGLEKEADVMGARAEARGMAGGA